MASVPEAWLTDAVTHRVPVWVRDEQWEVWHAWPADDRMTRNGEARTACGEMWVHTPTLVTSYHVLATEGCYLCVLALEGTPVKRSPGRPRLLPVGPRPVRGRPRLEEVEEVTIERGQRQAQSRTQRLLDAGAKLITYTRPDGREVTSAHPDKAMRASLNAEATEWAGSFEVGRRMVSWPCMRCGTVIVTGDRYCSTWCVNEQRREDMDDTWERYGLAMARRQFEDVLYRRPRRDSISSWTPPLSQRRRMRQRPPFSD